VKISGTRKGLEALQKAINSLISKGSNDTITSNFVTMTNDGEGYEVTVEMVPTNEFEKVRLPYVRTLMGEDVNFTDNEFMLEEETDVETIK